jgi:Cu+-exporting ATPase
MSASPTQLSKSSAEGVFSLFNLGCSSCSKLVERELRQVSGISDVTVDVVTNTVRINYNPVQLTAEGIRKFVKELCYTTATPQPGDPQVGG